MLSDATFLLIDDCPSPHVDLNNRAGNAPGDKSGALGLAGALVEKDFLGFLVVG